MKMGGIYMMMDSKPYDRRVNKKTGEELQQYLAWRRKGSKVPAKKGKGSYNRRKFKKGEI